MVDKPMYSRSRDRQDNEEIEDIDSDEYLDLPDLTRT